MKVTLLEYTEVTSLVGLLLSGKPEILWPEAEFAPFTIYTVVGKILTIGQKKAISDLSFIGHHHDGDRKNLESPPSVHY